MKKILVAIVAVLFAAPSFAQFGSGGFSLTESTMYYGVRLGLNVASLSGDISSDWGAKAGFNFGGVVGMRLSDATPIFLESGLYYTERGAKDGDAKIGLTYLEIPLLIKYGIQATDDIAVLPYIGPAVGLGIAGKIKPGSVSSFGSDGGFNRPDVGIKLGCGAEYNHLYLEAGYQFGMANIADSDDDTVHGNAFFVNFGVNF
ncbi:MAG: PorT family protein [Prevotella sp.]|nr:PorT family protein [Prevotella sp.]